MLEGTLGADKSPAALRGTLALLTAESGATGGPFAGRIDVTRVAATGHSAGGGAVLAVAADPAIDAWATYASGGFGSDGGPAKPSLLMGGTTDDVARVDRIESAYGRQTGDKRLVTLEGAGHLAFSDICAVGRDRGGVLKIAADHGVDVPPILMTLGSDGCAPEDLPPEEGWRVIDHYTTAHLRAALGMDASPLGLGDESASCFDGAVARYAHQP